MMKVKEHYNNTRVIIARPKPSCMPFFCLSVGSLPANMEINTMLSIPKTISNTVSVASEIQVSRLKSNSIIVFNLGEQRYHYDRSQTTNPSVCLAEGFVVWPTATCTFYWPFFRTRKFTWI